ncbi:hypothetical protein B0H13DRAFT_1890330 [Mycena leptocephala]|nr:hypothetical protein B0H13DRAFT_1890330 [Mycena leptocephala]
MILFPWFRSKIGPGSCKKIFGVVLGQIVAKIEGTPGCPLPLMIVGTKKNGCRAPRREKTSRPVGAIRLVLLIVHTHGRISAPIRNKVTGLSKIRARDMYKVSQYTACNDRRMAGVSIQWRRGRIGEKILMPGTAGSHRLHSVCESAPREWGLTWDLLKFGMESRMAEISEAEPIELRQQMKSRRQCPAQCAFQRIALDLLEYGHLGNDVKLHMPP